MAGTEKKCGRSPLTFLRTEYRRYLPYIQPENAAFFVTWTLANARPVCKRAIGFSSEGAIFAQQDRELDRAESGPRWLEEPAIGHTVIDVLFAGAQRGDYELGAWVIMPNHIHILIAPAKPLWTVIREIKSGSGRIANRILGRAGQPFWDREYYDRRLRNDAEEAKMTRYIEYNPVRAGLCCAPELWQLSSAHFVLRAGHGPAPPPQPSIRFNRTDSYTNYSQQ